MKALYKGMKRISRNQTITGFATLVGTILGFIAALTSESTIMRVTGCAVGLFAGLLLIYIYRNLIAALLKWLSWKFALGILVGAIAVVICYVPVTRVIRKVTKQHSDIEITHTVPKEGGRLDQAYDSIDVFFSKDLTQTERRGISISLSPKHPFELMWMYVHNPEDIHQLTISPDRYYPNENRPRFEYNTEYAVTIQGPSLSEKVTVRFKTPETEGSNSH